MLVLELVGSEAESIVEGRDDAEEQMLTERRKRPMLFSNSFFFLFVMMVLAISRRYYYSKSSGPVLKMGSDIKAIQSPAHTAERVPKIYDKGVEIGN